MLEKLQKEYKLQVIKDLGMFEKNNGTYKLRKVVLLCPECNSEFTVDNTQRNKQREMCFSCLKESCVTNKYTRLYNIWKGMRSRVNSTNPRKERSYKAKNITVCDEWSIFETFKDWALANGYADELTIDRRDNDLGYNPGNCRWVGAAIQSANTRQLFAHNTSSYRGVSEYALGRFHSYIGVDNNRITIGYYETAIEAAKARDTYIIDNDLEHTLNNVLIPGERVEQNYKKLLTSKNTSGYRGVSFIKRLANTNKPWFVQITIGADNRVFSKYYSSAEEAAFFREHFIYSNSEYINRLKHNFTYEQYEQLKSLYLV